jgi:hypothetical protein
MNSKSGSPQKRSPDEINRIFAQLDQQDVEQFYAGYQHWTLQEQIKELQTRISDIQAQIVYHHTEMQRLSPTPIALASLARLQSNGVNDTDLLDRMFERGEEWLDQAMQRLAYCEQMNFIHDENYTEWCEHALEGAYDWISSIQLYEVSAPPLFPEAESQETKSDADSDELPQPTEEMLLHKLMSEDAPEEQAALKAADESIVPPDAGAVAFNAPDKEAEEQFIPTEQTSSDTLAPAGNAERTQVDQPIAPEDIEQTEQAAADVPEYSWVQTAKKNTPGRKRNIFQWIIYILLGK